MPLVSKAFGDIITFTRASTGTYFDATGTLQSAAVDEPRFDYDPATLAAQGFLIEEARTNLALYSAKLDQFSTPAVWTLTGAGATLTATTDIAAPDGTMTAWTLTSSGATAQIQQSPAVLISTTYTGSFWIRRRSGTGTVNIRVVENVNTPLTGVTSQWQRFNFTATSTSTTGRLGVFLSGVADEVDIWGAQLEAGTFPTSYIPTTTTALTRSADVASVNTLSPWYSATEGTLYAEYIATNSAQNNAAVALSDGTNNNRMTIRATNASAQTVFIGVSSGSTEWAGTINTALLNTITKSAFGYKVDDISWVRNGGTVGTDTTAIIPTVTGLKLGADGDGTLLLNGYLRRITYYPRRLSNAELVSITS